MWQVMGGTRCQVRLAPLLGRRALSSSKLSVHRNELFLPKGKHTGRYLQNKNKTPEGSVLFLPRTLASRTENLE